MCRRSSRLELESGSIDRFALIDVCIQAWSLTARGLSVHSPLRTCPQHRDVIFRPPKLPTRRRSVERFDARSNFANERLPCKQHFHIVTLSI